MWRPDLGGKFNVWPWLNECIVWAVHGFGMGTSTDKFKKEFYQRRWAKRGPFFSYSELIESARAFEFAASAVMNSVLREYKYKLKLFLNMYCRRRWGRSTAWKIQTIKTRKRQEWGGGGLMKNFWMSTRSRTRQPLYDDLEFKIQISTLDSIFLDSFYITVLINYVRLNCRIIKILFEDK